MLCTPRHLNSSSCWDFVVRNWSSLRQRCKSVFTHIKQQLLGTTLFIERTQSYLKWPIVLITLCSYSQFSVRWTNKRSVWESTVWLAKSLFKTLFKIHFYKLAFTALTVLHLRDRTKSIGGKGVRERGGFCFWVFLLNIFSPQIHFYHLRLIVKSSIVRSLEAVWKKRLQHSRLCDSGIM